MAEDWYLALFFIAFLLFVAALLRPITFAPVFRSFATRGKLSLLFGGAMVLFFMLFGISPHSSTKPNTTQPSTAGTTAIPIPEATEQRGAETTPDQIKRLVAAELAGQNNFKKDRLRSIKVIPQAIDESGNNSAWSVILEFNADENLTTNLTRTGIEKQMSLIYRTLYTSGLPITRVSIEAHYPLVDKYGNESDGMVLGTSLDQTEASKVNWNADQSTLLLSIVPGVWTTWFAHPDFK